MKSYKITINGNVYNATVEPVTTVHAPIAAQPVIPVPAPVAPPITAPIAPQPAPPPASPAPAPQPAPPPASPAPAPKSAPQPAPAAPVPAPAGSGTKLESPMPGTIIKYLVNVGDEVSQHQVVAILEAMKMENEIVAPTAGKITSIVTAAGSPVNAGDIILTIE